MTNKGKMIEAIYAACLTKRATLVIFYLINRSNQELTCFPSVGKIAKECNMSMRTVQRALNDLEGAGFLERESRFHEKGGQKSSLFRIHTNVRANNEIEKVDFTCIGTSSKKNEKAECEEKIDEITVASLGANDQVAPENALKKLIVMIKYFFSNTVMGGRTRIHPLNYKF